MTDEGKEPNKLLILSTTYHHANPPWNLILKKHKPMLELSPDCQRIALSNLCTAFKANPSLRNILFRAQLPDSNQQPQIPRGTQPCGRNCFCCKILLKQPQTSPASTMENHSERGLLEIAERLASST